MLFDRKKFWELGGFHEQILFAEDYRLSQQVERRRFAIVRGGVYTHESAVQADGTSARGMAVPEDGFELLE